MIETQRKDEAGALVDALAQTAFAVSAVLNRLASENGLSATQLRALGILRDRRSRMSELADYLGLDRSTLSGLMARAEKRGLVERAPNPEDGRAVDVFLSVAGRELSVRLTAALEGALTPLVAGLGAGERKELRELLERMLRGSAL
ncbi:MAG TPA: MarR family transcriptional regulator [Gryllotalpicola sp.]